MSIRSLAVTAVTLLSATLLACSTVADPSTLEMEHGGGDLPTPREGQGSSSSPRAVPGEGSGPSLELRGTRSAARRRRPDTIPLGGDEGGASSVDDAGVEDGGVEDGGVEDGGVEDGGVEDGGVEDGGGDASTDDAGTSSSGGTTSGGLPVDANADAGPKPTALCTVSKNRDGFFTRTTAKSSYVAYVPASYTGENAVRLVVGLHGCGDTALNFAAWGVNPYDTRDTQEHIGISIGGREGGCWTVGTDDAKVLAAIDDIRTCFWVHEKKVVVAGYSSGGELAYHVGLTNAARFAGILIEDSGLYEAGNSDTLLAGAAWKLNIAHRTHTSDPVFPLSKVQADWAKALTAGFPLITSITPGDHDGESVDWSDWLIPQSLSFVLP